MMEKTISTVRNTRAIPWTWEKEKNGNNLLSTGSHETGVFARFTFAVLLLFLINQYCITGKKDT
jgi:hypothetical protein